MAVKALTTDMYVDLTDLFITGKNPRTVFDRKRLDELKSQIREAGKVYQALLVEPKTESGEHKGKYGIIAGQRRYQVLTELAKEKIKIKIPISVQKPKSEADSLMIALLENDGEPLSVVDKANAYKHALELGMSRQELCVKLGKTNAHMTQMLQIAESPDTVKKSLASGKITVNDALTMLKDLPKPPKGKSSSVEDMQEQLDKNRKAAEEKVAKAVEQKEKERTTKQAAKKEVAKAQKDTGVTLSSAEKAILSLLSQHGVDGFIAASQRAVSIAIKMEQDKTKKAHWKDMSEALGFLAEALADTNMTDTEEEGEEEEWD